MASSLMRYILCLLCTCQISILWSQYDQSLHTARYVASGGQDLIMTSTEALYSNPASLLNGSAAISGIMNYANRYGTDIRSASAGVSWSSKIQSGGLLVGNYGISGFRQNQVSAAYARKLSKGTRLGIQINYFNLQIEDFGSQSNIDLNVGVQHEFTAKVSSGFYLLNPLSAVTNGEVRGGIGLSVLGHISDALSLYTSIFRDWDEHIDFRPGLQYQLIEQIDLLISFNTKGASLNFGTDISLSKYWSVILAYNTHQFLGNSLSFSTTYVFQYQ